MTREEQKRETMKLLDRFPEMIPVVHEVLKEGLRLDRDGGGTPENVAKHRDFAGMLLEELKQEGGEAE